MSRQSSHRLVHHSLVIITSSSHDAPLPFERRHPDVELVFHYDPGNAFYLKKQVPSVTAESFYY